MGEKIHGAAAMWSRKHLFGGPLGGSASSPCLKFGAVLRKLLYLAWETVVVLVQEESFKAFHKFVTGREMVPLQTEVLKVLAHGWVGRLDRGSFALVGSPAARANMVSQFLKHGCALSPI